MANAMGIGPSGEAVFYKYHLRLHDRMRRDYEKSRLTTRVRHSLSDYQQQAATEMLGWSEEGKADFARAIAEADSKALDAYINSLSNRVRKTFYSGSLAPPHLQDWDMVPAPIQPENWLNVDNLASRFEARLSFQKSLPLLKPNMWGGLIADSAYRADVRPADLGEYLKVSQEVAEEIEEYAKPERRGAADRMARRAKAVLNKVESAESEALQAIYDGVISLRKVPCKP